MRKGSRLIAAVGAFVLSASAFVGVAGAASTTVEPRISISSASIVEGDTGTRPLKFLVSLSQKSTTAVTVTYSTVDVTAHGVAHPTTPGGDYQSKLNMTLTFMPGQVAKTVAINTLPDTVLEGDQTFDVDLTNIVGATPDDVTGVGTILDDDPGSGFRLGIGDTTVREGDGGNRTLSNIVSFSGPAPSPFTLVATTADGTAHGVAHPTTPGGDYVSVNKSISVRAGARFATVPVVLLPDDLVEGNETFSVSISSSLGTVTRATGTVTITDDPSDDLASVAEIGQTSTGPEQAAAIDGSGDTIAVGDTDGTVAGAPEGNAGGTDVFVVKYDAAGSRVWAHEIGTSGTDFVDGLALDASGDAVVVGSTMGTFPGSATSNAGSYDGFVVKYNSGGTRLWTVQLGTTGLDDIADVHIFPDGDILVGGNAAAPLAGAPEDQPGPFAARYDPTGNLEWIHQRGVGTQLAIDSSGDIALATGTNLAKWDGSGNVLWTQTVTSTAGIGQLAVDGSGNVFVTGTTNVPLTSNPDGFLAKYDTSGNFQWAQQLGLGDDGIGSLETNGAGDALISGALYVPQDEGFVAEYDPSGTQLWIQAQIGVDPNETPRASTVAADFDASGDVIATGSVTGDMVGAPEHHQGRIGIVPDAFVVRYDGSGNLLSAHLLVTQHGDYPVALALDSSGQHAVVSGITYSQLPYANTPSTTGAQVFLERLNL